MRSSKYLIKGLNQSEYWKRALPRSAFLIVAAGQCRSIALLNEIGNLQHSFYPIVTIKTWCRTDVRRREHHLIIKNPFTELFVIKLIHLVTPWRVILNTFRVLCWAQTRGWYLLSIMKIRWVRSERYILNSNLEIINLNSIIIPNSVISNWAKKCPCCRQFRVEILLWSWYIVTILLSTLCREINEIKEPKLLRLKFVNGTINKPTIKDELHQTTFK